MTAETPPARPLAGRRVLVTRARIQAPPLATLLQTLGADPVLCSTIETVLPDDTGPLDAALASLATYDGVLVTSANTARFLGERMAALGIAAAAFAGVPVAAIGPATATALQDLGVPVALVPRRFVGESLVEALGVDGMRGRRFLLPRAAKARDVVPDAIGEAGGVVDIVTAYVTRVPPDAGACLRAAREGGPFDAVLFTSPSTAHNLVKAVGGQAAAEQLLAGAVVACIGPVAADTARQEGLAVDIVADPYTISGLVRALEQHFVRRAARHVVRNRA